MEKRIIYLDNAATTFPKPDCVYSAVDYIQRSYAVNAGRGSYSLAKQAVEMISDTRKRMASLVGVNENNVVFSPSATIAANQIIYGLTWNRYSVVYVSPFEHNAIIRPLKAMQRKYGFQIIVLPFLPDQTLNESEMIKQFAIMPPSVVFITQISNVTGLILPTERIAVEAKKYNAFVVIDGAQSLGLIPLVLSTMPFDIVIFAGHKSLYGSFGLGGFIINTTKLPDVLLYGGTGTDTLSEAMPVELPGTYESGSPNIIAIGALNAALTWASDLDPKALYFHEKQLTEYIVSELSKNMKILLYLPHNDYHVGAVAFNHSNYTSEEVGMILDEDFKISVRCGYQCAPIIHNLLSTQSKKGVIRASVGFFNTKDDIDVLISALNEI